MTMGRKENLDRNQLEVICLEDLVPANHLVRKDRKSVV